MTFFSKIRPMSNVYDKNFSESENLKKVIHKGGQENKSVAMEDIVEKVNQMF